MKKWMVLLVLILLTGCARQPDEEWGRLDAASVPTQTVQTEATLPAETMGRNTGLIELPGMVYTTFAANPYEQQGQLQEVDANGNLITQELYPEKVSYFLYSEEEIADAVRTVQTWLDENVLEVESEAGKTGRPWRAYGFTSCEMVKISVDLIETGTVAAEKAGSRDDWADENMYAHYLVMEATLELTKADVKNTVVLVPATFTLYRSNALNRAPWQRTDIRLFYSVDYAMGQQDIALSAQELEVFSYLGGRLLAGYELYGDKGYQVYTYMEESNEILCHIIDDASGIHQVWAYDPALGEVVLRENR